MPNSTYKPNVIDFFYWIKLYAVLNLASDTTSNTHADKVYFKAKANELADLFSRGVWHELITLEIATDLRDRLSMCPICFKNLKYKDFARAFDSLYGLLEKSPSLVGRDIGELQPVLFEMRDLSGGFFRIWASALERQNRKPYFHSFDAVWLSDELEECYQASIARKKIKSSSTVVTLGTTVEVVDTPCCCAPWFSFSKSKPTLVKSEAARLLPDKGD